MGRLSLSMRKKTIITKPPIIFIFAGNNGSGKSTIRNLMLDFLGTEINVDADAIARRLDPRHPESKNLSAGREAIKLIRECIDTKRDFSMETTLAGRNAILQMRLAKENGYEITMFYVGLNNVSLNIQRVANRVKNGGHNIPTENIIRRHHISIKNLIGNIELIDNLIVMDNSDIDGRTIIEAYDGKIKYQSEHLPSWAMEIIHQLNS